MNIYDVSKQAGVSIATVSRVLNNSSNVSEKTKQKVLQAIDVLGYTPNIFARGLGLGSIKTIGILCTDLQAPYVSTTVHHLQTHLQDYSYHTLLCSTGYELEQKKNCLMQLRQKQVDGVILVGSDFVENCKQDNHYLIETAKEVPIMILNGYLASPNIYSTLCDDYQGAYLAASTLFASGCKKLLFLFHRKNYSFLQMKRGILQAILERPDNCVMLPHCCPIHPSAIKEELLQLHKQGVTFDGIVTTEESLAIGALKYAHAQNLQVPDDLSMIGYHNTLLSISCEPELSTIDTHIETLTATSVQTLMRVLDTSALTNTTANEQTQSRKQIDKKSIPHKILVSCDLIERNTVK